MRALRFVMFACAAAACAAPPAVDPGPSRIQAGLARLPLRFEANMGQWSAPVRYAARADGYTLLFTAAGPSLTFAASRRVDLSMVGSAAAPEIEAQDRLATRTDYFLGAKPQWRAEIPTYSSVRYRQVYPGIDVVYYGNRNLLEYDFVVAPGADPSAIRFRFEGADRVSVTPQGDLLVETATGQIVQKRPVIYQQASADAARHDVAGRYAMDASGTVAFELGGYDRSLPLVIDPYLFSSTYLGGAGADQVNAMKLGTDNKLYVVGSTTTNDLPATDTAFSTGNSGVVATGLPGSDVFIAVLDSRTMWVTYFSYFGGSGADTASSLALDSQGFLYICGTTNSATFPLAGVPVQGEPLGTTYNAFVAKFNPAADGINALWYSTFFGGTDEDYGMGVAVDGQGKIYMIGTTRAGDLPVTDTAYAAVLYGIQDAFLCKIDPDSSNPLVYSTYLGGELSDEGRAIAVKPDGTVYFAATTFSTQFPLANAPYRSTLQGGEDIVVGVMDMTQSGADALVYDTYFGGSDLDAVRSMSFDPQGRLILSGFTLSFDFPVTYDAVQQTLKGNADAFVSVVDPRPGPFVVYSTYLGGKGGDVAYDAAADSTGSIYVTGYTLSPDFPVTFDAPQSQFGNGTELFVAKLKPGTPGSGGLQFSTYLGTEGVRVANCLALGTDGKLYVGGYTSLGLPITANAYQGPYGGGTTDGFLLTLADLVGGQPLVRTSRPAPRTRHN